MIFRTFFCFFLLFTASVRSRKPELFEPDRDRAPYYQLPQGKKVGYNSKGFFRIFHCFRRRFLGIQARIFVPHYWIITLQVLLLLCQIFASVTSTNFCRRLRMSASLYNLSIIPVPFLVHPLIILAYLDHLIASED